MRLFQRPRQELYAALWHLRLLILAAALAVGACTAPRREARQASPAPAQPIPVEWANPSWGSAVKGGWTVRTCTPATPSLCVQKGGEPIGNARLKDLPSLGEEKTTSSHQVQAVLAGRINSLYQFKIGRWANLCKKRLQVSTSRPERVAMGGAKAMKYELVGSFSGKTVEHLIGYWAFRDGIETVIEASAATPERCVGEPLGQIETPAEAGPGDVFRPQSLRRFEPILDRMVAGSRLPPPTQFTPAPAG